MMETFLSGSRLVDIVFVFMAIEIGLLLGRRALTGRGIAPTDVIILMLPGAFLLLALRAAIDAAAWSTIAACLIAAFVAHAADLWRRHARLKL